METFSLLALCIFSITSCTYTRFFFFFFLNMGYCLVGTLGLPTEHLILLIFLLVTIIYDYYISLNEHWWNFWNKSKQWEAFFFLLGWIIYITMNNYTPALLNAQSKLRSTVKFSLHFSLNSFKPWNYILKERFRKRCDKQHPHPPHLVQKECCVCPSFWWLTSTTLRFWLWDI